MRYPGPRKEVRIPPRQR